VAVSGVPSGLGAVLFCRGLRPDFLEIFTYGEEHWGGTYDEAGAYREPSSDHETILGDPAWADVVRAAQLAWRDLRAVVDPEDRGVMNELETKWGRIAAA